MFPTRRNLAKQAVKVTNSTKKRFKQVKYLEFSAETGLKDFNPNSPARFKNTFREYPAIAKWFIRPAPELKSPDPARLNLGYLEQFGTTIVPLELTKSAQDGTSEFKRFEAPLSLLLSHMTGKDAPSSQLYLAQHAISDLPAGMQADLATPEILKHLGKGDIYASSLWMGRPPTRTPLHRDPNPNLLIQLSGKKVVRLMEPTLGNKLYESVKEHIGKTDSRASMRGEEMMQGKELKTLEAAVWDDKNGGYTEMKGFEIELGLGDGLYIPLGWWHAVHGVGTIPNVSVCYSFESESGHANSVIGKLVVSLITEPASHVYTPSLTP